ncbi:MAG: T9SS type A sorting domain-containing protein [Candidatus Latescibacterota bacterium]|nr:MAG: T9SS type A sorting domain-containing protein [Candidatus Latescibacterota bacterium]
MRCHPNPFNPTTRITYVLPTQGRVELSIFDVTGRLVDRPIVDTQPAGEHAIEWDAGDLASGVYFCHLDTRGMTETRKLVLLK